MVWYSIGEYCLTKIPVASNRSTGNRLPNFDKRTSSTSSNREI